MSKENVEIVKSAFAEFERGNFWLPDIFDPGIRIVWLSGVGFDPETVGLDAMSAGVVELMKSFDLLRMNAERYIDAGDQVIVIATWIGAGKASGVSTEWRHGQVWTITDGRVTEIVSHADPEAALEAAGLRA